MTTPVQPVRDSESSPAAAATPCGFGSLPAPTIELPEGHVVRTFMEEHQRILAKLSELQALAAKDVLDGDVDRPRLESIRDVARHLIGAEPHHQREEQVLFPALERHHFVGPPSVMAAEHVELRALKHSVADGAEDMLAGAIDPEAWTAVRRDASFLVVFLREHIQKEDNILYPMALRAITDPAEWEQMRERCDEIGYCCHGG